MSNDTTGGTCDCTVQYECISVSCWQRLALVLKHLRSHCVMEPAELLSTSYLLATLYVDMSLYQTKVCLCLLGAGIIDYSWSFNWLRMRSHNVLAFTTTRLVMFSRSTEVLRRQSTMCRCEWSVVVLLYSVPPLAKSIMFL